MRTTMDIPEELIEEAMKITGAKTKSQAIKEALESQIKRAKRQRLLNYKGKIDLNVDLDITRDRG
ncbi:MAG: type II toxin-antitoxin system VapB family antitoxin [Bacteroidota bacterium]